jgi:flavin reductase (DIM6/NTAB) family NADH-FMN oxidoreductase RutF
VLLEVTARAETAAEGISEATFAQAMSALASGVAIVTCWIDGRPWGMTVTAFTSVSAEPPTILVSLGSQAASARAIAASGRFGVSILDQAQTAVALHGSAPGLPKFLDEFTHSGAGRAASPVVACALAHLDCKLERRVEHADHTIFFGRVLDARVSPGGLPLVYFRRAYRALAPSHPSRPPRKRSRRCRSN